MMKIKYIILLLVPAILLAQGSFRRQKIDRVAVSTESQITMEDTVRLDTLTGDTVPFLDASKDLTSSSVTPTELGYVSGVTGPIQTQIDGKEPTLTKGDLTETGSSILTVTGGTGAVIGSGVTLEVQQASSLASGYLTSTDWSLFNGKQDTISGTANEIDVIANVVSIVDNPVFSGLESITLPAGADGDRPASPVNGMIRYNTTSSSFEGYQAGAWGELGGGGGVGGSRLQLISDPSFEEGVTEGSCTGCTATQDTTDKLGTDNNLASLKMAFSAASGNYTLTKSTSAQYSNVAGVVSAWIKTSASDCHFDELVDGAQSQTVAIGSSDEWKQYIINGTTGTTSYGWRVRCDTSITDDVFVDETFAGAAEPDTFDIGTASLWGSGKWEYTAAVCNWAVSSSTFASPAADADCDTPELKGNYTQVASTNIPALKFSYLKAGSYKIIAKTARMYKNTSVTNNCGVRFFDGTNASSPIQYGTTGATETQNPVVIGQFDYTTDQNDITFELQFLANSGGNCGIYLSDSANYNGMEISVYHYPSPQKVVAASCSGLECVNEFSSKITHTSGSTVIDSENVDWIDSCSTADEPVCTFKPGIFASAPSCQLTVQGGSTTKFSFGIKTLSATSITLQAAQNSFTTFSGSPTYTSYQLNCQRQGSDYKQFDSRFIPVTDNEKEQYRATDYIGLSSNNLAIPYFGNVQVNTLSKYGTMTNDSSDGACFTASRDVEVRANSWQSVTATNGYIGFSKNASASQLDTDIAAITDEAVNLGYHYQSAAAVPSAYSVTEILTSGETLCVHTITGRTPEATAARSGFNMVFSPVNQKAFIGNLTPKEFVQTPGSTKPVLVSALVTDGSSTTTVSEEDDDFINGNCTNSALGEYVCTFTTDYWSAKPHCWIVNTDNARTDRLLSPSVTSVRFDTYDSASGGKIDSTFYLFCKGQKN